MTNTTETAAIVIETRMKQKLSLRQFAQALSDGLISDSVSHNTVKKWEKGALMQTSILTVLALHTSDWRREFALRLLRVLRPEMYPDQTRTNGGVTSPEYDQAGSKKSTERG